MSLWLLMAAVLIQDESFETFGETQGWQIARSGSSCLMVREFGGEGNTILTLSIDPGSPETPLRLLVGNSRWGTSGAKDARYAIFFRGNDANWPDLVGRNFASENEDGSVDGVISLGFTDNAMTPVLEDMAGANGLRLSRGDLTISEFNFDGAEAGIKSLGQCVAALP